MDHKNKIEQGEFQQVPEGRSKEYLTKWGMVQWERELRFDSLILRSEVWSNGNLNKARYTSFVMKYGSIRTWAEIQSRFTKWGTVQWELKQRFLIIILRSEVQSNGNLSKIFNYNLTKRGTVQWEPKQRFFNYNLMKRGTVRWEPKR